jgi:hypothetical protein
MSKVTFEYVISALGWGVFPRQTTEIDPTMVQRGLRELTDKLARTIQQDCENTNQQISALYNAYTEDRYPRLFDEYNLPWNAVYADSGGLQIITAGKQITDELKQGIYNVQTHAHYAMCFDEIPLTTVGNAQRSRNERTNISNKRFDPTKFADAAIGTGRNIKNQIEAFRNMGAGTKVIIIIQGNTPENMRDFYRDIANQLDADDYNYVHGMAIADTCIGTGAVESIKMLRAAHLIAQECHPAVSKHLHILGIGSLERMKPVVYLSRVGYLQNFKTISYDSSSHTSTFDYGVCKLNGQCRSLGLARTANGMNHFCEVYNFFEELIPFSKREFIDVLYGDGKSKLSYTNICNRNAGQGDKYVVALLSKAMHTYFQIHNFTTHIDRMWNEEPPVAMRDVIRQVCCLTS